MRLPLDLQSTVTAIVTFFATYIVQRVSNRRGILAYSVTHDRIGISAEDPNFGSVAVTFNDQKYQNLFLSTIELKNESLNDYENIDFRAWSPNTKLMTEQTLHEETGTNIHLSNTYQDKVKVSPGSSPTPEQYEIFHSHREYSVPVLNRGRTIKITYLNSALNPSGPTIWLSASIKGVRLKYRPSENRIIGISTIRATSTVIVIGILGWILITSLNIPTPVATAVAILFGISTQHVGAYLAKAWQWLRNAVGG